MSTIWLKYVSVAGSAVVLLVSQRRLQGTTLVAPVRWSLVSCVTLGAVEALFDFDILASGRESWRFLAATSTLCPGIALLGAKRPQNAAWQWIVASLWLVIALPAVQQLVFQRVGTLELHAARSWFTLGLILFCMANSCLSRYWFAVLLGGCGQLLMLEPHLPLPGILLGGIGWSWGMIAVAFAVPVAWLSGSWKSNADSLDHVWLDFRNRFGIVWSLRMMEQFNSVARANGWQLVLQWNGFRAPDGSTNWQLSSEQTRVLRQSLQNLLRRFVSPEWIASRFSLTAQPKAHL